MSSPTDNPFAILSFLAAPAILTNASTVLALGTSNRLARAADRARLLSAALLNLKTSDSPAAALQSRDFDHALLRSKLLLRALRCFYFAAGAFAGGTCVSLIGATGALFDAPALTLMTQGLTMAAVAIGVGSIVKGAAILVGESRFALKVLDDEERAVEEWRKTR